MPTTEVIAAAHPAALAGRPPGRRPSPAALVDALRSQAHIGARPPTAARSIGR
jgi:hypothetical protein